MSIKIKRVYEHPDPADGTRILVDRLWPRGLSKEEAKVDIWLKEIAPSTELRIWFAHDPKKWIQFQSRYLDEIKHHDEDFQTLKKHVARGPVTLVYGAKDDEHNQAVVLQRLLRSK